MKTTQSTIKDELIRDQSREEVFLWILVVWLCLLLYFDPRLLALTYAAPNILSKLAVVIFVFCLDSIWLYTVYHTFMIAVSLFLRRRYTDPVLESLTENSAVAILYPTRNDFSAEAVASCLDLAYPNAQLFILDDSTLPEYQKQIDQWAASQKKRVIVLRRQEKHGYKAGNLNHALGQIKKDYPFFVICDADGILPGDFISKLLPYFYADNRIAFVQSAQQWNCAQKGFFPCALGYLIAAHYRFYVKARNRFGFVMFYGHGAILKTAVWQEVGDFPEIATEDLAYSAKLRECGYQGIFTERVVCLEDFPPGLKQMRVRSEKWIRGTSEFLKIGYGSFFRSPKVSWFEKVDVLINAFSHYQSAVMLVFLLMLGTLLPAYFSHFRYPGSFFLMPVPCGKSPVDYLFHIRYHIFWSWDFYSIMMASIVFPILPAVFDLWRKPLQMLRYIALSNFVFLNFIWVETLDLIVFLLTGKAVFRNTMDIDSANAVKGGHFHPNHPFVFLGEFLLGILMFWIGMKTKNLWFMSPAAGLCLGIVVTNWGWDNKLVRVLSYLPFLITLTIITVVTMDLLMMTLGPRI